MILVLITALIVIGAIVCCVIHNRTYSDFCFALGFILSFLGFIALVGVCVGIINAQANKDVRYQNTLYEKEMLEYRIDNMEDNIVGNEMLYNDIVTFNNELRSVKKWANNPWVNWFYNQDVAKIDYINLK